MKTFNLFATLLMSFVVCAFGQAAGSGSVSPSTLPSPTPYTVVSRGANSAVWQRTTYEQAPDGRIVPHVHSYTELASGLNYLSNGKWVPSREQIESYPGGAVAKEGQYQVIFANNLNSAGSIDMQTPDGKRLRSNILGLMYYDTASDQAVLIAQIQNSKGELISSNQVLYPDAFKGVKADVRYTYKKGSFEQDVILREQPPSPESFGLNPDTTEIEVMTEFLNPPKATLRASLRQIDGETDQNVSWGVTRLGRSRAFDLGQANNLEPQVSVIRQYVTVQGRKVLLEKVPFSTIEPSLQKLPLQASINSKRPTVALHMPALPPTPLAQAKPEPIKLAATTPANKGYVLDYITLSSSLSGYTFQGDSTYYVSGYVELDGPGPVIIEGGTVIKFAHGSGLDLMTALYCNTSPYHPAVLTAKDDNTVGETISGSTGSPSGTYADYAIGMDAGANRTPIQNLRVMYAKWGVSPSAWPGADIVLNCQFINDTIAILPVDRAVVENVLFDNVGTAFQGWNSQQINAAFITAHNVNTLNASGSLNITNSLFICVTNFGVSVSGEYNATNSSDAGVFQTVGGGSHYLATNSLYRDVGTTNIDPVALAIIQTRTTYPPIIYSNVTFTSAQTFSPQAQRDTDTPDLGYHYDPLDYAFGGCTANSNLTFTAGAAACWFELPGTGGPGFGIALIDHVTVAFQGTVTAPCIWARYDTVQEGNGNWTTRGWLGGITCRYPGNSWDISDAPQIVANFTQYVGLGGDPNHFRDYYTPLITRANHCQFLSGNEGGYNIACYWTNCFVDRMGLDQDEGYSGNAIILRNCTWHGGMLYFVPYNYPIPLSVRDCAFDGTTFTIQNYGSGTNADYDYNAYTNGAPQLPNSGPHDVIVTNFNWQSSWFGNYYLPPDSLLINAGDVTADTVGLYHFTTQTNQVPETNSVVDIGYHYVATDVSGNPLDSDGDGIPDYLEDANGNGIYDAGDLSDWTNFSTDGTGMSDGWEIKYFGHIGVDPNADPDGDGLNNLQEYQLGSDPTNANTFNTVNNDAQYFFTATPFSSTTKTRLSIGFLGGGLLQFSVSGGFANGLYDLYFVDSLTAQRWQWRRVYTGVQCDSAGNATFIVAEPNPNSGYFVLLSAADTDSDGLSDGYEAWFNYNGRHTETGLPDSDGDGMYDGWEVEYGLDPTLGTGDNGASGNPDGDAYINLTEYQYGGGYQNADYDPLEPYGTSANRPVVYVYADNSNPYCEQSSFTIYRSIPNGGNNNNALTVYYSVGGTLSYAASDYTLSPAPPDWPTIESATIPAGSDSVKITVDAPGVSPNPGDVNTVSVSLTPYAVAANPQDNNPYDWGYVLDWHDNRATITYDNQYLRPTVYNQSVQMCPGDSPKQITLYGYDNCGANLNFSVVSGPSYGSLSSITPINGTSASVTYTPNVSFCGRDSFTFKVNDGTRDSAPATVTIDVGDPNPIANPENVMVGENTSATPLTLSGSDSCGDTLTFASIPGLGPNDGTLGAISQIDPSHASVTYTPNSSFEGVDSFDVAVNNCGYSSTYPAQVTVYVVAGPQQLTAQCNLNQIVLNWTLDSNVQQMEQSGLNIYDFQIYRSTTQGGPYTLIGSAISGASSYVDMNVTSGVTYYYVVTFRYQDPYSQTLYESPYSGEASANPCSLPPPILPGFNQQVLAANDDNLTGSGESGVRIPNQAAIGFPINFFGTTYSTLFVNNNGNVTFNNYLDSYTPEPLSDVGVDIIAPFWADVDTRGPGSGLVTYGQGTVNGHAAFAINWVNVGYFQMLYDKLNSFQLVLIDRSDIAAGDFDMEFNYERVQWEAGQANGAIDGLGGTPPRVGYAAAAGSTFELNGSGVTGAFLDSNPTTGLIYNHLNTNFPGRYLFSFRDGTPGILPAVVFNPAGSDTLPVTVTLSVPGHPSASIYYTSDGTTPTAGSTLYSGPINVTANETLNAIAVETGWGNSGVSSASFGSPAPVITTQPSDQTATVGGNATFTVVANGLNPLQYQWIHNGNVVGSEAMLSLQNVQQSDGGTYYVIVTDPNYNSVQSSDATLTVTGGSSSSPTINIDSPAEGDSVSGTITVQATSQGTDPTVRASLWVDGSIVANQWFGSPYNFTFDTTKLSNGSHQLQVKTYDLYNNEGSSAAIDVNVNNLIYDNNVSAEAFIPNGDDASARSITFSANFTTPVNWTLTITGPDGTTAATFNGSGSQMSQSWDGSGAIDYGLYSAALTVTTSSQSQGAQYAAAGSTQTAGSHFYTIFPAPDWNNINSLNYHAYAGNLDSLGTWNVLSDYVFSYLGLSPATMVLPADVFTYENRIWETLFGYDGDQVVDFSKSDLLSHITSDNVCYILTHGFATATAETMLVDSSGEPMDAGTIYGANYGNTRGYMFVQINACNSGTYQDAKGNSDMAIAFGIANSPMTYRRAYLGWSARYGGDLPWANPLSHFDGAVLSGPGTLYTFDQVLWNDLYTYGMTVQDAAADAYASAPQPFAVPIIYGDPSLILPQLF